MKWASCRIPAQSQIFSYDFIILTEVSALDGQKSWKMTGMSMCLKNLRRLTSRMALDPEPTPQPSEQPLRCAFWRTLLAPTMAILMGALAASPQLSADTFTLNSVDYLGQSPTFLQAINGNGQILGTYGNVLLIPPIVFLTSPQGVVGSPLTFPFSSRTYIQVNGIDNAGNVIGSFQDLSTSPNPHGIFLQSGATVQLPNPPFGVPAISSNGKIVVSEGQNLYFYNGDGTYTTVVVPGAGTSVGGARVAGIDDAGNVAGWYLTDTGLSQAFFRTTAGNFIPISFPGSIDTEPLGMNNLGQVVGSYYDGSKSHGFIWNGGTNFITVDFPGATNTIVSGINDGGTIVGFYDAPSTNGLIGTPLGSLITNQSAATFVKTDTTTQGNWNGVYGSHGYTVVGDQSSTVDYVTPTPAGQALTVWTPSASDVRALQKPSNLSDRIAAAWSSNTSFIVDLNITDGITHQLAAYFLDWDNTARRQTVDILDASGNVLDTRNLSSSFNAGVYLTWSVSGHVKLRVTQTAGSSAVLSGLFFDGVSSSASSVLSITKTHSGTFNQGQQDATYTITVSNAPGANATNGVVTVTETLPVVSMTGAGWTCSATACSRSDALPEGSSYPPITATLSVAANSGSSQVNTVQLTGGGSTIASASDSAVINRLVLTGTLTHSGNFTQGQQNAVYTITVSNASNFSGSGIVAVTEQPPDGLTFVSMTGTGWSCSGVSCIRSDPLSAGSSYPPITLTVNVTPDALTEFLPEVLNQVTVAREGSQTVTASDLTVISFPATMISPYPGTALSGTSATFSWNLGSGVSQYWLYVSKISAGRNDLFDSGAVSAVPLTVNNLPIDGSTLYVTLYSLIGSSWQFTVYTYRACAPATMSNPASGSTLAGVLVTFVWNAGSGVSQYWLYVSKISGGRNDVFDSGATNQRYEIVSSLPTDGSTLYVTLYSLLGSNWIFNVYTYKAAVPLSTMPAAITSPIPNSTLPVAWATFQWNSGSGVSQYWLYVSKISAGRNDLFDSGGISQLAQTVNNLPTDGSTLYVTLYSLIGSTWTSNTYTFTAVLTVSTTPAAMTSPTPGSILSGASVTFQWNAGSGVSQYWLYASKISAGRNDLFDSGGINQLSETVNNLPTDGSTFYVTLYSLIGSTWTSNTYTYTAVLTVSTTPAAMTSPTPGSTLAGASATFQWNAGSGVSQYWLYLSKISAGRNDLFDSGGINQLSQTVNNLPTDGSTLYVTLYSLIGSNWMYNIYTYKASLSVSPTPAAITSPAPGSTLPGASATFQWNTGSGVSQYRLYVSKISAGRNDLFDSGGINQLSQTVNNLSTDGSTLYVTLYSLIGSTWAYEIYSYQAFH